jgi:site-specific DNA-cytosine methylase
MSKAATRAFQFVDQFCGGGGFSEGLRLAQLELGLVPEEHNLAVLNHWAPAIETHRANHPHAKHSAQGRLYLVQQQLRELGIDILFRMLEPKELAAAMGFPATYKWPCNKTKTTRMIGNAVAVNMAKALLFTILRSLVKTPRAKRARKPARPAGRVA